MNKVVIFSISLILISVGILSGCNEQESTVTNNINNNHGIERSEAKIIGNHNKWSSSAATYIYGLVKNTGNTYLESVKIRASFYDENDNLVFFEDGNIKYHFTSHYAVSPDEIVPFSIVISDDDVFPFEYYKLSIVGLKEAYSVSYTDFILEIINDYYSNENEFFNVVGEIENIGKETADDITIYCIFYDENDTPIFVEKDWLKDETLKPNDKSNFNIECKIVDNFSNLISYYEIVAIEDRY